MKDRSRATRLLAAPAPKLLAWSVNDGSGEHPEDGGKWALVYAFTEAEARDLALPHVSVRYHQGDWEPEPRDFGVQRAPEADAFARADDRVEGRIRVERLIGWRCEGDSTCSTCGLAEFDGEFPVCEDCQNCDECGHDTDCPEALSIEPSPAPGETT